MLSSVGVPALMVCIFGGFTVGGHCTVRDLLLSFVTAMCPITVMCPPGLDCFFLDPSFGKILRFQGMSHVKLRGCDRNH